jgi:large subunit ribosomal protein L3
VSLGSIGVKVGMTQIFDEKNVCIPVTLIKVGPCIVTQIKTKDKDGYNAIQLAFGFENQTKSSNLPLKGHLAKAGITNCKHLREYYTEKPEEFQPGQKFDITNFESGQYVNIRGKSIGKGFSGTVKKYNFGRGPMTHGSKNHRAPGSIGAGSTPGRVYPGKRMAGRLGGKSVTLKRLPILRVDTNENVLVVKGSVPGKTGNLLNLMPCI